MSQPSANSPDIRVPLAKVPAIGLWPLSVTVGMLLAIAGLVGLWLLLVR